MQKKVLIETFIYAAILFFGVWFLVTIEAFELFYSFSRLHENYELDELIVVLFVGAFCLAIFSYYRLRDLREKTRTLNQAHAALEQANEKMEKLAKDREAFMAVACHDLKSPLSGVVNALHLIELSKDEEGRVEGLGLAKDAAKSLVLLVDDVLDFIRTSDDQTQDAEPFLLSELMGAIELVASLEVLEKGLEFRMILDKDLPKAILGFERGLRQAVLNLVGNAVKYTPGGSVTVSCSRQEDRGEEQLVINVIDTGVGIPEEEQAAIFEPYHRIDESRSGMKGGLGLGLSIVTRLIERQNGTISVSSVVGEGSVFTITIPLIRA